MGVAPTGAIFKGLTFDGESSKDYGIYITGSAVFNAPARDVEMITIPGRNGTFALDHGRFENIEVTYPAGLFGDTEADFAQGISDFRNFLASRQGYVELSDEYNPGEYRLAVYKNGLDVTPEQLKAGEFEITFDCKPQRWLTAGQDPVSITSGDEITNPTLFDASPLLLVDGYGTINLGDGGSVVIDDVPLGYTPIAQRVTIAKEFEQSQGTGTSLAADVYITGAKLNTNDPFTINADGFCYVHNADYAPSEQTITAISITEQDAPTPPTIHSVEARTDNGEAFISWYVANDIENYGTETNAKRGHWDITIDGFKNADPSDTFQIVFSLDWALKYYGNEHVKLTVGCGADTGDVAGSATAEILDLYGTSTKNATGYPLYIDLDIGEAYKEEGGEIISSNSAVTLGATLPVLPPGNSEITFPNTIASLDIVPRWWKL